jgi:3-dehydroquinate synthase
LTEGLAEVIKHAIIGSKALWNLLSEQKDMVQFDWNEIIELSLVVKQQIVEQDPFEKGIRKTLNFGHTIGHALESHYFLSDRPLSHGGAITLGMMAELRIAEQMGRLETEEFQRIIPLIMRLLRPSEVTLPSLEALQHWLQSDKKKSNGIIGYSLPDRIGFCARDIKVPEHYIEESLNWLSAHLKASR